MISPALAPFVSDEERKFYTSELISVVNTLPSPLETSSRQVLTGNLKFAEEKLMDFNCGDTFSVDCVLQFLSAEPLSFNQISLYLKPVDETQAKDVFVTVNDVTLSPGNNQIKFSSRVCGMLLEAYHFS